jgi:drug/metabolite transporter (DMT)-like permease
MNTGSRLDRPVAARPGDAPLFGMAVAVAAFFSLNVMSLFAKLLSETHHVADIAFWRNLIAFSLFLVLMGVLGRGRDILTIRSKPRILITRSIMGTLSVLLLFGAFSLLPMANATALIFTSALFTPIFGYFVLGERVGPYRWSAIAVGFAGVLIVAQPGGGGWHPLGVALGLTAAVVNSSLATMLRHLGKSESPDTMTFYFLAIGLLVLTPAMPFVATPPTWQEAGLLAGLGISGVAMPLLIATAFKYAPAALVAPFNYTQMIWATLFGFTIFGEVPESNILLGSAIIIGSSLIVILREHYIARRARTRGPGSAEQALIEDNDAS